MSSINRPCRVNRLVRRHTNLVKQGAPAVTLLGNIKAIYRRDDVRARGIHWFHTHYGLSLDTVVACKDSDALGVVIEAKLAADKAELEKASKK